MRRLLWFGAILLCVAVPAVRPLAAQGVTTSAVVGSLTDDAGSPVPEAQVSLRNPATGQRWSTRSGTDGRFAFENVAVGGPYTIDVQAIGFEAVHAEDVFLRLGQRFDFSRQMRRSAVQVAGVSVTAAANPLLSTSRTGAQTFVGESLITRLPTLNRNFTDFINAVPQVVTAGVPGASVGGQNNRFNNIQVDGGVNNDVFGLAPTGTPGGQAQAHPISVEAIREYQVLIAPFDVRQGSFAGGLVNAVTKTGTNKLSGSAWGYFQGQALVGPNLGGHNSAIFHQDQYGFNVGGPIVRDKLLFFGSVDVQGRGNPLPGVSIGADTAGGKDSVGIGIRATTADSVSHVLQNNYSIKAGTFAPPTIENPDRNIFGKLSLQLAENSQLELSYNYVNASLDNLVHSSTATGFRDGYQLSNSGYLFTTKTNTLRGKWTVQRGRISNELIGGYQRIRDLRQLPNRVPLIFVGGDRAFGGAVPSTNIAAGSERFSQDNSLNQDIFEVTDNLTFTRGRHSFTVGTHNEFFHFLNHFFPASLGVWSFRNVDSLIAGHPFRYEIALPLRPGGPTADFKVQQLGGYVQDRFAATPRLTLTLGLRADVPVQKAPVKNQQLLDTLGINTGDFPTGNILWSPRVGFNYDVSGDGSTRVRGGAGIFSGRPPYVWISNAYGNTGREQATLICDGATSGATTDTVPGFTVDPTAQPNHCGVAGAGVSAAAASVVFFDPTFRFPQNLKLSLGADHQLPFGIVGTVDLLYTKAVNQFYLSDVNLKGVQGTVGGEAGRTLYGTINLATGATAPVRKTALFRDVIRHRNVSKDKSIQISAQLEKRFSDHMQFIVGYTYSNSQDLISLTSSIANSNFRFTTLDGTIENRNLRRSEFDIPHKISVTGVYTGPAGFTFSASYIGQSGSPYSYVTQFDVNGDGLSGNDRAYVPRDSSDITLATPSDWGRLNAYINGEPCLNRARGSLQERNSCRNPWINILNARITKVLPGFTGHRVEISADVFNLLHLLNHDWGVIRTTADFEEQNLLNPSGYDTVNQRFVYRLALPIKNRPSTTAQQWKIQMGLKYLF